MTLAQRRDSIWGGSGLHWMRESPFQEEIRRYFLQSNFQTISLSALFCLNISAFLVVVACFMGFTIQAATIYVPIAFSVIALNAGQKTYLIKKQQNSLASLISELLDDCSLWLVFPINALMGSPASPVLLLSLVVIGAFASNTISTRLISHFQ